MLGDPNEWRHIRPTIFDPVPGTEKRRRWGRDPLRFDDNDWRQVEVVSKRSEATVRHEIAAVQAIVDESRGVPGFTRVHLRREPVDPLAGGGLTLSVVRANFGGRESAFGFEGDAGVVPSGFALSSPDLCVLYGQARDDGVITLNVAAPSAGLSDQDAHALAQLLHDYDLLLVHWCRRKYTAGPAGALQQLLA